MRLLELSGMLVALVVLACTDAGHLAREVEHPIVDSLDAVRTGASVIEVRGADSVDAHEFLERFARAWEARHPLFSVGRLDGSEGEVLGEVLDAGISPRGRLFVLDAQVATVHVYDSAGRHSYSLGGKGEGPGEFDFPRTLAFSLDGDLWVVDGSRRVHRYLFRDGRYRYHDRYRTGRFARDGCMLGETLVVHEAARDPAVLHRFRVSDSVVAAGSFAVPYHYDRWLVRGTVSRGHVICSDPDGPVILGFENQNRLEAYDVQSGRILWHVQFPDLRPTRIVERERGERVATGIFDRPYVDFLVGIAGGDGVPVIVQYGRMGRDAYRDQTGEVTTLSYLVDWKRGVGAALEEGQPRVLDVDVRTNRIVTLEVDPHPRVTVSALGPLQ